jgi:hypothetical protein
MNKITKWKTLRYLACGLVLLAAPALAVDSALGGGGTPAAPADLPLGPGDNWIDHFDTYATGSQLHGQGGWEGWGNSVGAGALTSDVQARSLPNSVDIFGASDLTHPYTGYTTGTWVYTAWQYIPTGTTGNTYFILLNTYSNDPACTGCNWSTQVCFNPTLGTVIDDVAADCAGASTINIIYDQWVELRLVINLDTDTQTFFYNGQQLYQDTWTGHISGGGAVNIATVDLFANNATSVFYDDISLSTMPFLDGFELGGTTEWHATFP